MTRFLPALTPPSVDATQAYVAGFVFTPTAAVDIVGVWWYFPTGGAGSPYVLGQLFDAATQELVASTEVAVSDGWTPGSWHRVDFDTPYAAQAGQAYAAAVLTGAGSTSFDAGVFTNPVTSGDGLITTAAGAGRFRIAGGVGLFPSSAWNGDHGVDIEYVEHGVTPPPPPSGGMTLAAVMDEVAVCMDQVAGLNTYAWPVGKVSPPAAVVSYPTEAAYQDTRGFWRLELPLVLAFGRPSDPTTRDMLAAYLDGAGPSSVRQLVDDYAWTSCDHVTCKDAEVDVVTVAGVEYLAGLFTLDVVGLKKGA